MVFFGSLTMHPSSVRLLLGRGEQCGRERVDRGRLEERRVEADEKTDAGASKRRDVVVRPSVRPSRPSVVVLEREPCSAMFDAQRASSPGPRLVPQPKFEPIAEQAPLNPVRARALANCLARDDPRAAGDRNLKRRTDWRARKKSEWSRSSDLWFGCFLCAECAERVAHDRRRSMQRAMGGGGGGGSSSASTSSDAAGGIAAARLTDATRRSAPRQGRTV